VLRERYAREVPETRSNRIGAVAGISFVLIALVAGALPGAPPHADGKASTYQNYFIEHQGALVTQAWLYALAAPLMLMFAVSVRRILRQADGFLSDVFLLGTTTIVGLQVVTYAMQIAFAQTADSLPAGVVFTVGVHFQGVLIGLWGFIMATTAFGYACCVFASGVLPRWTAYLAVLAVVVSLTATAGVFFRTGPFCLEGGFSAWAPAVTTVLWYLGTSIAMLRTRDLTTAA
jgi:Domain of unknown function (DUF4386)